MKLGSSDEFASNLADSHEIEVAPTEVAPIEVGPFVNIIAMSVARQEQSELRVVATKGAWQVAEKACAHSISLAYVLWTSSDTCPQMQHSLQRSD